MEERGTRTKMLALAERGSETPRYEYAVKCTCMQIKPDEQLFKEERIKT